MLLIFDLVTYIFLFCFGWSQWCRIVPRSFDQGDRSSVGHLGLKGRDHHSPWGIFGPPAHPAYHRRVGGALSSTHCSSLILWFWVRGGALISDIFAVCLRGSLHAVWLSRVCDVWSPLSNVACTFSLLLHTSSTAQGGGGSFRIGTL